MVGTSTSVWNRAERRRTEQEQADQIAEIAQALKVLMKSGAWHELRVPGPRNRPAIASGYFNSPEAMAEAAFKLNQQGHNTYFTINPVCDDILARVEPNKIVFHPEITTDDNEIASRHWLFLDVDVKQSVRHIAATAEQHKAAYDCTQQIRQWLMEDFNWPAPVVVDSGNGYYPLFRIAEPNDEATKLLLERVLKAIASKYDGDGIKIDPVVFNASRLARIPGTVNRKGKNTEARPHREAALVEVPSVIDVVTREQLAQVPTDSHKTNGEASPCAELPQVLEALPKRGITLKQDGDKYFLSECAFDPSHNGGTSVAIFAKGGYSCYRCKDKHWGDLLKLLVIAKAKKQKQQKASGQSPDDVGETPAPDPEIEALGDDHQIAQDLFELMKEYIVAPDGYLDILSVYVLYTHNPKVSHFTPYLDIWSAERNSGKTQIIRVLKPLVRNPKTADNISPAALARIVELRRPTMLIDEIDTMLGPKANKETKDMMRGILNSGFEQSGTYIRCAGKDQEPKDFSTFCPKVIAGIGRYLDPTTTSRAIQMYMLRAPRSKCKRFRPDGRGETNKHLHERVLELKKRVEGWSLRHAKAIAEIEPVFPESFDARQCDISEPLMIIASVLGGEWPKRTADAITAAFDSVGAEDPSNGVLLLRHIRKVFLDKDTKRLHTEDLLAALKVIPEAPWRDWNNGKNRPLGLTDRGLAKLLKKYEITSTLVRAPEPGRGYKYEDFEKSFNAFLRPVCKCAVGRWECDCHEACNGDCLPPDSDTGKGM
jgi:hypothetical protein